MFINKYSLYEELYLEELEILEEEIYQQVEFIFLIMQRKNHIQLKL